jgi:outer membrane protein assembly factor BamB
MRRRPLLAAAATAAALVLAGTSCAGTPVTGGLPQSAASPGRQPTVTPMSPAGAARGAAWPTYHRTRDRDGVATATTPRLGRLHRGWTARLAGAVYGEPLVVDGKVVVGTERDEVYALSAATGRVLWRRRLAAPVPRSSLPCGDIDPEGITGTGEYDAATHDVYYAAEAERTGRPAHLLAALSAATGALRWRRWIDPGGSHPTVEQIRGALAVSNGRVVVPFGGLAGDCGPYHGYLVSVADTGQGRIAAYRVPSAREAGIWGPSGPGVNSDGDIYVSTGNGASRSRYDGSDSVIKLSPGLSVLGHFTEASFVTDNEDDLDLGSMGPLLLPPMRRLPAGGVVIAGKSGRAYLLDPRHLGGLGHPRASLSGCTGFGGAAATGETVYLPCTAGVRELRIGRSGRLSWGWQAGGISGSPVIGGGAVWSIANGRLYALSRATGAVRASVSVPHPSRFATPTIVGDAVYLPTHNGVVEVLGA